MLRYQYPGAVYHLMARGDGGKTVFEDDEDRKGFLLRLARVCGSHGWRVHAWVLMDSLDKLRKGERGKVRVAVLLRERTAAGNSWIAKRLCMGHHGSVSRLVVAAANDKAMNREKKKLEKMLKCVT